MAEQQEKRRGISRFRLDPRHLAWLDHQVAERRREKAESLQPGEEMPYINRGDVMRDLIDKQIEAEQ